MTYHQKKITLRERKENLNKIMVSTTFRVLLVSFIAVFSFLYVLQTNSVSTKGYVISDIEKSINNLESETKKLQVEIARHGSMQSIQERLGQTNLVAIENIEYLEVMGNTVARR